MADRKPEFFHPRYNAYVPAAQYADDVQFNGPLEVDFGLPAAASATAILSAQSIATATNTVAAGVPLLSSTPDASIANCRYGRNVTVVASGAATSNVTVFGRDYLGQPMAESFTLNGTTPVVGLKAFYFIDSISWGATAATTINVGWGLRLGLPYRTTNVLAETVNSAAGTIGTLVAPVLTDPQTLTTGDPRGTYQPNAAMNGATRIQAAVLCDNFVNAAGNGGLYGIRHARA